MSVQLCNIQGPIFVNCTYKTLFHDLGCPLNLYDSMPIKREFSFLEKTRVKHNSEARENYEIGAMDLMIR